MKQTFFLLFSLCTLLISCSEDDNPQIENPPLEIGDEHQGGIIFYIDSTGEHGLLSSTTDQSDGASWGCIATNFPTAQNIEIGSGKDNTQAIVANCLEENIAAKICTNLVLNGFDDWFLPSINELELMYTYRDSIGGFNENNFSTYTSSSEFSPVGTGEYLNCWVYDFGTVEIIPEVRKINSNKDNQFKVRAIREF